MILATTKIRLLQYLDYYGIGVQSFLRNTGIKRGFLDADKLNSTVSDTHLAMIIAKYPDLNMIWLITGEGDMLKQQDDKNTEQKEIVVYRSDPRDTDMIELQREHIKILKEQLTLGSARLDFHSGAPSTESTPIPSLTGPKRAKDQPKPH